MPWVAAGMAGSSLLGGILGNVFSSGDRDKAYQAYQQALADINAVGAPPDLSQQILMNHLKSAGVLTPQMEQVINQSPSQVAQISEDPNLKSAQMSALSMLAQRGQTGLSPEDKASFNQMRSQVAADNEGKRQQILQSFQARGQGGSGSELAAALNANANAQNQASQEGDRLAGLSSQRALEAMVASGQLGGQIRAQDFNVANTKAQAQDAINRFNTANQIGMQSRNVAAGNQAQQYNLANNQRISDYNTTLDNNELLRQNQAKQQYWDNLLKYGQAKAGAQNNIGNFYGGQANQTAQQWQSMGTGLGGVLGAYGSWQNGMNPNGSGYGGRRGMEVALPGQTPQNNFNQTQYSMQQMANQPLSNDFASYNGQGQSYSNPSKDDESDQYSGSGPTA